MRPRSGGLPKPEKGCPFFVMRPFDPLLITGLNIRPETWSNSVSHAHPKPLKSQRAGALEGRVAVPGDKSISHRALMFAGLATGQVEITGLLEGEDVLNTARAMQAMGAQVEKRDGKWVVRGRGVGGLQEPTGPIDFGNSGTGVRLMMGVIAGHEMTVELVGDASLSKRPMKRILTPLREMGIELVGEDRDTLPLTIKGNSRLIPIAYELPVPSAQVKSAVLIAGLHAAGETTVLEREATRDHTERMLRYLGAEVREETRGEFKAITIKGHTELKGRDIAVPGDPSSAAFLVAAALIVPGSEVTVEGVLVNPSRTGFYETLLEMGADIAFLNERESGGERIADIRARSSHLKGVRVPPGRAPSMIDEYPMLAAVAATADGETRMEGLAELKVKESDRLQATAEGLAMCGVQARVVGDTLIVTGAAKLRGGGPVQTHLDHRIAMAFLTLGLVAEEGVTVDDSAMIATSFPEFQPLMTGLGAKFEEPGE
jgi:3-phosphoshikimate 1-carboxyvinyltransferase